VDAVVRAQARGVLSGMEAVRAAAGALGLTVRSAATDGMKLRPGSVVVRLHGDVRRVLAVERTLLNFLMHASGVATETARAVARSRGAPRPLQVWATRKTLPGLRDLEKAAVVHGGGHPHRRDLSDALLIKNNHLALLPVAEAVRRARARARRGERVEVEVRTARQAVAAARAGAQALLLDNVSPTRARAIVRTLETAGLRRGRWVELSGGITPERVARYRSVGADAVSLGALTHSAPALPFHLSVRPARLRRRAP
jgi:nicotinate-nucleotide pyrophosphorylase (carboxylating)